MKKGLNFNIDGAAVVVGRFIAARLIATLGTIAIAAGSGAAVGTVGGIDSTLNRRGNCLGLYGRHRTRHYILWNGHGQGRGVDGRNGHKTSSDPYYSAVTLPKGESRLLKHLVADAVLEKVQPSQLWDQSFICGQAL